ncbi:MAG: dipeptide ABC transporter ATP-binding protein, partial [Candidatus Competibacterales bacterium]
AISRLRLGMGPGELLGVGGEARAGKSTIGNAVTGLLEPPGRITGGSIHLRGERIDTLDEVAKGALRGRRVGMIFQDPLTSLDPLQTVGRQLMVTLQRHLGLGDGDAKARAVAWLQQVGIPDPGLRIHHYPHQFSGGMRQRVVIALALCGEPELVIADEPTTALDVSVQAQILDLLKSLCRRRQVGMVLITHDMGVIAETCDRVVVMYRGVSVEEGATAQVLTQPSHDYTQSLVAAVPRADRRLARFPSLDYGAAAAPRPGLDLASHWLGKVRDYAALQGPLLEVDDLAMRFTIRASWWPSRRRYLDAVAGVSFAIGTGEVFGLVGESGSGKSTVARLITGLYVPTGGAVRFAGQDLTALGARREVAVYRRQMQMIFQDPFSSLNGRWRVGDIVAEPIRFHRLAPTQTEVVAIVADLLEVVGLGAAAAQRFPHEFSGGQRQRISIARALATRPRFLLCDEPTSALDVSIQAQILNLLKDLQQELSLSMLFISHDLPVIRQMCDRVGVMRGGQLLEVSPTEQLFENPSHPYTRQLLDLMPKFAAGPPGSEPRSPDPQRVGG